VHSLVQLRGEGKYLVFLSRTNNVRIIGDLDAFRSLLATKLKSDSIDADTATATLSEIRQFLGYFVAFGSVDQTCDFLVRSEHEEIIKRLPPEQKRTFKDILRQKLNLVAERILKGPLTQRVERLGTAVAPCLEDLDTEVIAERQDEFRDERISSPFLRLRIRYSEAGEDWPFLFLRGTGRRREVKSFEIECDETDIDLLLRRLLQAKETLLRATDETKSAVSRMQP
jgi:hypothetical protein